MLSFLSLERAKRKEWGKGIKLQDGLPFWWKMKVLRTHLSTFMCSRIVAPVFLLPLLSFLSFKIPLSLTNLICSSEAFVGPRLDFDVNLIFLNAQTSCRKQPNDTYGRVPAPLIPDDFRCLIRPVSSTFSSGGNWSSRLVFSETLAYIGFARLLPPSMSYLTNFLSFYPSSNLLLSVNPCCLYYIWIWAPLLPPIACQHMLRGPWIKSYCFYNEGMLSSDKQKSSWLKFLINILDKDQLMNIVIIY